MASATEVHSYYYDSYTLGPAGNRTRVVEVTPTDTRTVDWAYDDLYRLTKETIKVDGDTVRITEYDYDDVGNRLAKTLIEGTNRYDTTYAYDNMDRLMTESTTTTVLADAVAGPDEFWLAANPRRAGYYAFIGFCALALSAALAPLGWLGLRRRVARVRVLPAPWGKRETRRRAKNGSIALLLSTLMIVGPEQVYALGNDAAAVHAIATAAIGTVPPSSVAYTYDANGNMISKSVDGATATLYSYDAENRLVSIDPQTIVADIVTYAYDDDGIRKSKTVGDSTTHYLTDKNRPYAQVLEERDETGALLVRYTYGHDLIAQTRPDSGGGPSITRYYHYDGQMSTRLLSDENATPTVTDNYNYEAFGELLNTSPGTTSNNYLYTGEQYDGAASLYYLRARYYDQATGRFCGRDPASGSSKDPRSLHRYTYTANNPTNLVDFSGRQFSMPTLFTRIGIGAILAGVVIGGIIGGIDAKLGGGSFLAGAVGGAIGGGILGATFAHIPFTLGVRLFLAGITIVTTAAGTAESFSTGNNAQGIFRLVTGAIALGYLVRAPSNNSQRAILSRQRALISTLRRLDLTQVQAESLLAGDLIHFEMNVGSGPPIQCLAQFAGGRLRMGIYNIVNTTGEGAQGMAAVRSRGFAIARALGLKEMDLFGADALNLRVRAMLMRQGFKRTIETEPLEGDPTRWEFFTKTYRVPES